MVIQPPAPEQQWHAMARHLVQAHGALADSLIGYAPTLEQFHFAHADTHLALASINELPPDRHTHSLPMNAGWWNELKQSFRPFPPSPAARDDPFPFPGPHQTGLPHTDVVPGTEADLADWADGQPFEALRPASIKLRAAVATAAWAARADFPSLVPSQSRARADRSGVRQPQRPARRAARGPAARRLR